MTVTATIENSLHNHQVSVQTDGNKKAIAIPAKTLGAGSSVNGGELLFLSLATCYCNDIYHEAARRNMTIDAVNVTVSGEFGGEGEPAFNICYEVHLQSDHSAEEINDLIHYVDNIAEVHNTLRKGTAIKLVSNHIR